MIVMIFFLCRRLDKDISNRGERFGITRSIDNDRRLLRSRDYANGATRSKVLRSKRVFNPL